MIILSNISFYYMVIILSLIHISMYLNEFYELNMKTYGIEDMRITMKRKAGFPADDEMNKEEGGAAMETLLEIVMEIVMEGTLYTVCLLYTSIYNWT